MAKKNSNRTVDSPTITFFSHKKQRLHGGSDFVASVGYAGLEIKHMKCTCPPNLHFGSIFRWPCFIRYQVFENALLTCFCFVVLSPALTNMTSAAGGPVSHDDNPQSTPIQSNMNFHKDAPPSLQERQLSDSSTISSSSISSSTLSSVRSLDSGSSIGGQFLLPIPNPGGNKSQASFSLSDDENQSVMLDPLPEEIANADLSIASEFSVSPLFFATIASLFCIRYGIDAGSMRMGYHRKLGTICIFFWQMSQVSSQPTARLSHPRGLNTTCGPPVGVNVDPVIAFIVHCHNV